MGLPLFPANDFRVLTGDRQFSEPAFRRKIRRVKQVSLDYPSTVNTASTEVTSSGWSVAMRFVPVRWEDSNVRQIRMKKGGRRPKQLEESHGGILSFLPGTFTRAPPSAISLISLMYFQPCYGILLANRYWSTGCERAGSLCLYSCHLTQSFFAPSHRSCWRSSATRHPG